MKKTINILASLLILSMTITSCKDFDEQPADNTSKLTFYLQTASEQTRAYEGTQAASELENAINTIKVWLYDGETKIGYTEEITGPVLHRRPQLHQSCTGAIQDV